MPSYTSVAVNTGGHPVALLPQNLASTGALLQCAVAVDARRAQAQVAKGEQLPPQQIGLMLIDPGASMTSVERSVLIGLGIPDIGECEVKTPSGGETQLVYPCNIAFPGTMLPSLETIFVLGANLKDQGIIGLMGRDVLAHAVFVYNGPGASFTLAF